MQHNEHMGALQALVVHDQANHAELQFFANPQNENPARIAQEHHGSKLPNFSSPTMAAIAEFGEKNGLRLIRVQVMDRRHQLLAEPLQGEVSAELVERFRARGHNGLAVALKREFPNYFLNGVQFFGNEVGLIEIRRNGVLLANDKGALVQFVKSAWTMLQLS